MNTINHFLLKIIAVGICSFLSISAFAGFEESNVPVSVRVLYCDNNSRILVQFADVSKNIWYPANAGDQSKAFLATALAAKLASQKLYYYGLGDPLVLTNYCINVSAREVKMFGLE